MMTWHYIGLLLAVTPKSPDSAPAQSGAMKDVAKKIKRHLKREIFSRRQLEVVKNVERPSTP